MSIYAQFDEDDEAEEIATNRGWSGFCDWACALDAEKYAVLIQLCKEGLSNDIPTLIGELKDALKKPSPDEDVAAIGSELLESLLANKTAGEITIG